MKKMLWSILFLVFFSFSHHSSMAAGNTIQGTSNALYSSYGIKKSKWCLLKTSASCKDPSKFLKYKEAGCINDVRDESKCLLNFCGANCATSPCPTGQLDTMCKEHCQNVSFPNNAQQNRLNACVEGSLGVEDAARKRAGRVYDKAYLQNLERQKKGGLREAQKVLDLVKTLSAQRKTLFYIDGASFSKAGIVRIDDFLRNVDQAIILTQKMNDAVNGLAVSGQAPDIVAQARSLMARSDQEVDYFVRVVSALMKKSQQLMQVVKAGETAGVQQQAPIPSPRASKRFSTGIIDDQEEFGDHAQAQDDGYQNTKPE